MDIRYPFVSLFIASSCLIMAGCSPASPSGNGINDKMGFAEFTYEGKAVHLDKVKLRIKKTDPNAFLNIAGIRKCYCSIYSEPSDTGIRTDYISISFEVPFDSITGIKDLEGNAYSKKAYVSAAFGKTNLMSTDKSCKVKFLKIDADNLRAYGTFSFSAYLYEEGMYGEDWGEDWEERGEEMPEQKEVFVSDGIFFAEIEDLALSGLAPAPGKK
jgi:hypothetical protein